MSRKPHNLDEDNSLNSRIPKGNRFQTSENPKTQSQSTVFQINSGEAWKDVQVEDDFWDKKIETQGELSSHQSSNIDPPTIRSIWTRFPNFIWSLKFIATAFMFWNGYNAAKMLLVLK